MLAHDDMVQIEKQLDLAKMALSKANTLMSRAISTDDGVNTHQDPTHSADWGTMVTDIATAITAVGTVQAAMHYYPEKP
jgi:hypothetical protein